MSLEKPKIFYHSSQPKEVLCCIDSAALHDDDVEPSRTDQTFYIPIDVQVRNFIASGQSVMAVRSRVSNLPLDGHGQPVIDETNNVLDDQYPDPAEMPMVSRAINRAQDEAKEREARADAMKRKKESDKEFIDSLKN